MKEFVRSIFRIRPFEKILVFLLGNFPNKIFTLLVSPNSAYPPNSFRICKRYGIHYCLDINDYQNWLLYFYNHNDSSFGVLNYINDGGSILDIGGNIGQTALMMASKTSNKSTVYSFEPYPATYRQFVKNLALNKTVSAKIKLLQLALGSSAGNLNMYEDCPTNSGANRVTSSVEDQQVPVIAVPVSTIDIFVKENQVQEISFIKIDVEGFEMEVLKGGHETLVNFKPSLFIEIDDANLKKQHSSAIELCKWLEQLGYIIYEEGEKSSLDFSDIKKPINIYCPGKSYK